MSGMLRLAVPLLLCFAACDDGIRDTHDSGPERFPDLSPPTIDPGCGVVLFCLPFLPDTFSECVLPLPPGYNTPAANAFYQCVDAAANGGPCTSPCAASTDAGTGTVSAACAYCLEGTCTSAGCSGGACAAEAAACGYGS